MSATLPDPRLAGQADAALRRIGFDGERLLRLAHQVANDELRRKGSYLGDRYEDLVGWLVVVGCRAAIAYNPARANGNYQASTYLYDVMEKRIPDFYRRKGEGFGDTRKKYTAQVDLVDEYEPADNVDFEGLVDDRRRSQWQRAADVAGWSLEEWVVITLDKAARGVLQTSNSATPPAESLKLETSFPPRKKPGR
jgi:hypothetical protein